MALFIGKSSLFGPVQLDALQAVAARATLDKWLLSVAHAFRHLKVSQIDLTILIEQLPSPFVLLGDFIGHSPLSGDDHCSRRGRVLEGLFSTLDLCILSGGSETCIHPASGSASALDLAVCGPSLVLDCECSTHDDLCGSDPVVLAATSNDEDRSLNRWNFGRADWLSFRALCRSRLTKEAVLSAEDPASIFTKCSH